MDWKRVISQKMDETSRRNEAAIELTRTMVSHNSVSNLTNKPISQLVASKLESIGFSVEWLEEKIDQQPVKISLAAKRGSGTGGVCYLAHTDVVPVDDWSLDWCGPFDAVERNGRLYGRGTCDMKGSLACALVAAEQIPVEQQIAPIYMIITADEEIGMQGAKLINEKSHLFEEMVSHGTVGIVGEPTELKVFHAHKGAKGCIVSSKGESAHTSTGRGINANYRLIPALVELLNLRSESESNAAFRNRDFEPPTISWNMTITNEPDAVNITTSLAQANIFLRTMPNVDISGLINSLKSICDRHQLDLFEFKEIAPWSVDPASEWVRDMLQIVEQQCSETVCFATDAGVLQRMRKLMICGPGSIEQAHRNDEWVSLEQLARGVEVYRQAFLHWACK